MDVIENSLSSYLPSPFINLLLFIVDPYLKLIKSSLTGVNLILHQERIIIGEETLSVSKRRSVF